MIDPFRHDLKYWSCRCFRHPSSRIVIVTRPFGPPLQEPRNDELVRWKRRLYSKKDGTRSTVLIAQEQRRRDATERDEARRNDRAVSMFATLLLSSFASHGSAEPGAL